MTVDVTSPNVTGINPWWTYEEHAVPGVGKAMANVANGNLIVQSDDVDIPERGIDLAFRRTYNSRSQHDYANTDGSVPSNFGNGWTNTFDAHIASNTSNGITVYDIDGARYDYGPIPQGQTCYAQPTGVHEMLCPYVSNGVTTALDWTKKSGAVYQFYLTTTGDAYAGRLQQISARNNNNAMTLTYSWRNNDSSSASNLVGIIAKHSDGDQLTLTFGYANGYAELQAIVRPDGVKATYTYDTTGELTNVCEIGNNTTFPGDTVCSTADPHNHHQYGYYSGTYLLNFVNSPNWVMSSYTCGDYQAYAFDGANRLTTWADSGMINPYINDGSSGSSLVLGCGTSGPLLQPSIAGGVYEYYWENFTGGYNGTTTANDSDGHKTTWTTDSAGRLLQTQEVGTTTLTTSESWDASNNLVETVDARGNATDYAYDGNGNTIAMALPAVTIDSSTFRPTSLYSYDAHNNISAYCDPVETHLRGLDWTAPPSPSDTLCASTTGAVRYTWSTSGSEPYGFLADTYTAMYDAHGKGYHYQYLYTQSRQGGDFGLPTDVIGDPISQSIDTSTPTRTPHQSFGYDSRGHGNLVNYSSGEGTFPTSGTWTLTYDALNRLTVATDPDDVTTRTCYYHNGQVQAKQTAQQYAMDNGATCGAHSTSYSYDGDLNETSETHHFGCVSGQSCAGGITYKWYDAADRLVEVRQPLDGNNDAFANPWSTRYFYDLTRGGSVALVGTNTVTYKAYGNLFKTQELLLPGQNQQIPLALIPGQTPSPGALNNTSWTDISGTAYDALDRAVTKYQLVSDVPQAETFSYDSASGATNAPGLLVKHCIAVSTSACSLPTYDADGHVSSVTYLDSTPSKTYTYDADGRTLTIAEPTAGTQSYTYDLEGHVSTSQDPTGGTLSVTSPAKLTYNYYNDGKRSSLDVSSSGLTQTALFAYAYRPDGKLEDQQINDPANAKVGNSVLAFSYSLGGRLLQRMETVPNQTTPALSYGYDINSSTSTGLMASANFPVAMLKTMTYDAESEPLAYAEYITGQSSGTVSMAYTIRGELLTDSRDPYPAPGQFPPLYANGLRLYGNTSSTDWSWDARRAVLNGSTNPEQSQEPEITYSYDIAGRQTGYTKTVTDHLGNTCTNVITRQYDAENRIIAGSQTANSPTNCAPSYYVQSYDWGPNGHPARIGSAPSSQPTQIVSDTLHWDGDQLLFTTDSQGRVDDIKVGDQADITPRDPIFTGITFWDHFDGTLSFCHNSSGSAGTDTNGARITTQWSGNRNGCLNNGSQTMQIPSSVIFSGDVLLPSWNGFQGVGQGGLLGMARSDGIEDGFNVIQGARTYDPSAGTWTTPDVYAGEVHDPTSQKAYMWK